MSVFVHVHEFDTVMDIQFCFLYNLYFGWNNNNKSTTTANIKHYTARNADLVYVTDGNLLTFQLFDLSRCFPTYSRQYAQRARFIYIVFRILRIGPRVILHNICGFFLSRFTPYNIGSWLPEKDILNYKRQ